MTESKNLPEFSTALTDSQRKFCELLIQNKRPLIEFPKGRVMGVIAFGIASLLWKRTGVTICVAADTVSKRGMEDRIRRIRREISCKARITSDKIYSCSACLPEKEQCSKCNTVILLKSDTKTFRGLGFDVLFIERSVTAEFAFEVVAPCLAVKNTFVVAPSKTIIREKPLADSKLHAPGHTNGNYEVVPFLL
jgi:hypothetical protein